MYLVKFLAAAALAATLPSAVAAQSYTVNATQRGWINQNGNDNGSGAGNNYLAGNCVSCFSTGEYRDFFDFTIPTFTGIVTSASISLPVGLIRSNQSSSLTYTLTSTSSQTFAGLGTGTVYASGTFTPAQTDATAVFALDPAALAALTGGGSFLVSGRVTSPMTLNDGSSDELIFGGTGPSDTTSLSFTTAAIAAAAPEPGTWGMMILGFGAIGYVMRRQRKVRTTLNFA